MIVSDASVQNNGNSSFAWVIVYQSTPLWHGMGLTLGDAEDMHSGHAEAFSILTAIIFLSHYILYYNNNIQATMICCYCNNMGMVTSLTNLQQEQIPWPNDVITNDCDIVLETMVTAKKCTGHPIPVLTHTRTPGQKTKPTTHYCWATNVDCDTFAKKNVTVQVTPSTNYSNPALEVTKPHITHQE